MKLLISIFLVLATVFYTASAATGYYGQYYINRMNPLTSFYSFQGGRVDSKLQWHDTTSNSLYDNLSANLEGVTTSERSTWKRRGAHASIRWTAQVRIPFGTISNGINSNTIEFGDAGTSQTMYFYIRGRWGGRLYFDGTLVIDTWGLTSTTKYFTRSIVANTTYDIQIEYLLDYERAFFWTYWGTTANANNRLRLGFPLTEYFTPTQIDTLAGDNIALSSFAFNCDGLSAEYFGDNAASCYYSTVSTCVCSDSQSAASDFNMVVPKKFVYVAATDTNNYNANLIFTLATSSSTSSGAFQASSNSKFIVLTESGEAGSEIYLNYNFTVNDIESGKQFTVALNPMAGWKNAWDDTSVSDTLFCRVLGNLLSIKIKGQFYATKSVVTVTNMYLAKNVSSYGNNFCASKPSCSGQNDCSGKGMCVSTDVCSCSTGYTGSDCNTPTCYNQANCSTGAGVCVATDVCKCFGGYSGSNCSSAVSTIKTCPYGYVPFYMSDKSSIPPRDSYVPSIYKTGANNLTISVCGPFFINGAFFVAWEPFDASTISGNDVTKYNIPSTAQNSSISTNLVVTNQTANEPKTAFYNAWLTGDSTEAAVPSANPFLRDTENWAYTPQSKCTYCLTLKPLLLYEVKTFKTAAGDNVWTSTTGDGVYKTTATLYIHNSFGWIPDDISSPPTTYDWSLKRYKFEITITYETAVSLATPFTVYRVRQVQDNIDTQGQLNSIVEIVSPEGLALQTCIVQSSPSTFGMGIKGVYLLSDAQIQTATLQMTSDKKLEEYVGTVVIECNQMDCAADSNDDTQYDCTTLSANPTPLANFSFTYDQGGWSGNVAGKLEIGTNFWIGSETTPFRTKMTGGVTGENFVAYSMCLDNAGSSQTTLNLVAMSIQKPTASGGTGIILKMINNKLVTGFGALRSTKKYASADMATHGVQGSNQLCIGLAFNPAFMISVGGNFNLLADLEMSVPAKKKMADGSFKKADEVESIAVNVEVDTGSGATAVAQESLPGTTSSGAATLAISSIVLMASVLMAFLF